MRSKIRSFFSAPPVARTCGLAWMGNATERTMCACCSVCRHSPVYVSQTLLWGLLVGIGLRVGSRLTLRNLLLLLLRWQRLRRVWLARRHLCGRGMFRSWILSDVTFRSCVSVLPVSCNAVSEHRVVICGELVGMVDWKGIINIPLHDEIK